MTTPAKTPTKRTPKAAPAAAPADVVAAAPAIIEPAPAPEPAPVEAPAPKVEAPKVEAPTVETTVAAAFASFEMPKFELPKFEMPKFEFPTFDAAKFEMPKFEMPSLPNPEIPAALRDFAEKAVAQAKTSFEKLKVATEEATDALEDTYEASRAGFIAFNSKTLDAAKVNSDAALGHAKDMLSVKTVAQAIELQTAFVRQQYEAMSGQAKELQELATKLAGEAAKPAKDALGKTLEVLKKD